MAPLTWDQVKAAYLADCRRRRLRPATLRYYAMALNRFSAVTSPSTLDDLSVIQVRRFLDELAHLSPTSLAGYQRVLRTLARWLVEEELLPVDPLTRLRRIRVDTSVITVPTSEELRRLFAAAPLPFRFLLATLIGTGIRVGELCGLDVADLCPDQLTIRLAKARRGRVVPLDPTLGRILRVYVRDIRTEPRTGEGDPLFVSRTGHRMRPGTVASGMARSARRAGLKRFGPHRLRHWFARDLAEHDTSIRLIAARGGWAVPGGGGMVGRYAPVAAFEVQRDAERYAPAERLEHEGFWAGLLPRPRGSRER